MIGFYNNLQLETSRSLKEHEYFFKDQNNSIFR